MIQVDNLAQATHRENTRAAPAAASSGRSPYDTTSRGSAGLPLHHPSAPPPLAGPGGAGQGGAEGVGPGGHVVVHWTQSGPTVQPAPDKDGSEDDDDDYRPFTPPPPRERLSYTRYQLELLNGIYSEVRYPNSVQKQLIAKRVGITREQVKIWFQNRRRKDVVGGSKPGDKEKPSSDKTDSNHSDASCSPHPASCGQPSASSPDHVTGDVNTDGHSQENGGQPKHDSTEFSDGDSTTDSKGKSACGKNGGNKTDSGGPRMVPEIVLRSVISELDRFSNENLKSRKEKRKKHKHKSHSSSAGGRSGGVGVAMAGPSAGGAVAALGAGTMTHGAMSRLFQTYDMVAPPNKVTPTAFLNTAANRFNHSHNTSAFSSPRDVRSDGLLMSGMPRFPWEGLEAGYGHQMSGSVGGELGQHHARGLGSMGLGLSSDPSPRMGLGSDTNPSPILPSRLGLGSDATPTSIPSRLPTSVGVHDTLPVLSDLLSYRQQLESAAARESAQTQSSLLSIGAEAKSPTRKLSDSLSHSPLHNGVPPLPPSSLTMNRVFPFPFVADPPIMLSSLHQHDPLRAPPPHWPPAPPPPTPPHLSSLSSIGNVPDAYKPVMISSFTNPFFPHPTPPTSHAQWPSPGNNSSTSFTQL